MMDLPVSPQTKMSAEQHNAWQAMKDLLTDVDQADARYDRLVDSEGGRVISTDIARHLDQRYDRATKGTPRDIVPGDDLAWRYAHDRLARELDKGGKGKLFRMMAGGWAAGKTHAVQHLPDKPDLVWDGTLSKSRWAATYIDFALKQKWKVEIVYIYRNLELALYGAIQRAEEVGRSVPLNELPASHRSSQQSVLELSLNYAGTTGVSFLYVHNLGRKGAMAEPLKIVRNELELHGPLHYLDRHESYYRKASTYLHAKNYSA
jgi:hypothetical protein